MKTLLIIVGVIAYLFVVFCIWAIVYVGTGGHADEQRRRREKAQHHD